MFDTTVVIPTKDRPAMLYRAVLSISQQKLLPKKVVIIDDCSKGIVSQELFADITNLDITIINNKTSLGGACSRNLGIEFAKTTFISFLDDDDAWDSSYLFEVEKVLKKNIGYKQAAFTTKKFVLSTSLNTIFRENIFEKTVCTSDLMKGNPVGTTSCVTVSKQSLIEVGLFDEKLPALQDYDLWLRLSLDGNEFIPVKSTFVYYTINIAAKQISGNYNNHINARVIILCKYSKSLISKEYNKLNGTLTFFTAKAIHRKNYVASIKYTLSALKLTRSAKVVALLIPYRVFGLLGIYTT